MSLDLRYLSFDWTDLLSNNQNGYHMIVMFKIHIDSKKYRNVLEKLFDE